jgi:hypothetical protein
METCSKLLAILGFDSRARSTKTRIETPLRLEVLCGAGSCNWFENSLEIETDIYCCIIQSRDPLKKESKTRILNILKSAAFFNVALLCKSTFPAKFLVPAGEIRNI